MRNLHKISSVLRNPLISSKCLKITCHLKLVKVWGVSEKLPCVIAIMNSLLMSIETI